MNGADAFDIFTEVSGRRVRRWIAWIIVVGFVLFREQALDVFNWYVTQRAHEFTDQLRKVFPTGTVTAPLPIR